jgi:broad specificity phosphatase PhoE
MRRRVVSGCGSQQTATRFDRFFHGGLNRQKQTLEAISAELAKGGANLPAVEIHNSFAEFDLKVWGIIAAKMRHGHAEFTELFKQWNQARHENASNKGDIFKQLTGHILKAWVAAGENFTEAESFPAFQKRVLAAMEIHSYATLTLWFDRRTHPKNRATSPSLRAGRFRC